MMVVSGGILQTGAAKISSDQPAAEGLTLTFLDSEGNSGPVGSAQDEAPPSLPKSSAVALPIPLEAPPISPTLS